MSDDIVAFLAGLPLLGGVAEEELANLAAVLRRRDLTAGEVLWNQGDEAVAMVLLMSGRVSISLHLPGERTVEVASLGGGEVLGEIPLLDGGRHSATARAAEPVSLLSLNRAD